MSLKPVEAETTQRQKWKRSFDFLFSMIGVVVGLGNLWRFPYLCFENGGGAFLIPYTLSVVFIVIPVTIFETSFGQYCQQGLSKSWNRIPLFKGVGLAGMVTVFHSTVCYIIILVWVTRYLVSSCENPLPWTSCNNTWNTKNCVEFSHFNLTVRNQTYQNGAFQNASARKSSAEEFWRNEVLQSSNGIENPGSLRTDLALYLLVLWVAIYFCTFKGIKWSSKVVYVTATLPVILIVVIVIHTSTLDGASDGIYFYLVPDMTKLAKPEVWLNAATQAVFSVGSGRGVMIVMSSFNKYDHNFFRFVLNACF
ncbi:sodium- and chloride-dependent creatine transporter 1-like [Ciona intestinalis]